MTQTYSDMLIPSKKIKCAFNRVCKNLVKGGYGVGEYKSLKDLLEEYGWDTEYNSNGGLERMEEWGKKYRGYDDCILEGLAPYVSPGCEIRVTGEDQSLWRWIFDGETCKEECGTVTYG